jgi:hypothetical protein
VLLPSSADLLVSYCVQAACGSANRLGPILGACQVLQSAGDLDWGVLQADSEQRRLILPVLDTLRTLASQLGAPVPANQLESLAGRRVSMGDRLYAWLAMGPPRSWKPLVCSILENLRAHGWRRLPNILAEVWRRLCQRPRGQGE